MRSAPLLALAVFGLLSGATPAPAQSVPEPVVEEAAEAPTLYFVGASATPVPGWPEALVLSDSSTVWLGPDSLRVEVGGLDSVRVQPDFTGEPLVYLRLSGDAVEGFAALTGRALDRPVAVVVDGRVMAAPVVRERIAGGRVVLNGLPPKEARRAEGALRRLLRE